MTHDPYKDSGVDIAAADDFVDRIRAKTQDTFGSEVLQHSLGYAALFRPEWGTFKDPVIASTCDGVGTKLLVAKQAQSFRGLGQDLVAMSVNDLLPVRATPLFFLDYIATGAVKNPALDQVMLGVTEACRQTGCALVGGETAEMPGVYGTDDFDLAGFAVGIADAAALPDPGQIQPEDIVLALPSSGIHSNGFSLVRKWVFDEAALATEHHVDALGETVGEALMRPTELYVQPVKALQQEGLHFKAAAHITGGGLFGRLEKLRSDLGIVLNARAKNRPKVFDWLRDLASSDDDTMARTFNMGWGFAIVVAPDTAESIQKLEPRWTQIGTVTSDSGVRFEEP